MKIIYICTTEDKKQRIFYSLETNEFYSCSIAPTPTKYMLIFSSIVGFVLLRTLGWYKLPQDKIYTFYLSLLLGIFLGGVASLFIRYKKPAVSDVDLNKQDKQKYILLGEKQLDQQKAGLFFVFLLAFVNTCTFFLDNSIVTMLVLTFVYFNMVIFINYMDIFKRKKTYQIIKKEME